MRHRTRKALKERNIITPLWGFAPSGFPDQGRCPWLSHYRPFRALTTICPSKMWVKQAQRAGACEARQEAAQKTRHILVLPRFFAASCSLRSPTPSFAWGGPPIQCCVFKDFEDAILWCRHPACPISCCRLEARTTKDAALANSAASGITHFPRTGSQQHGCPWHNTAPLLAPSSSLVKLRYTR